MPKKIVSITTNGEVISCYDLNKVSLLYREDDTCFLMLIDGVQLPMKWDRKEDCDREFAKVCKLLSENSCKPTMQISALFSMSDLQDALQLHLEQLQRLGATIEDSICEILRKMIENYDKK